MKLRDLFIGAHFRFPLNRTCVYRYRGNGWYSAVSGQDGGPWHRHDNPEVVLTDK